MVAPPKTVSFADNVAGGPGGGGSTLPRDRTNIYSNGGLPFCLSQPFKQDGPQPSGQFPAFPEPCFGVYGGGNVRPAAYHQNPFSRVNVQPTLNPEHSFASHVAYHQSPYPRPAFGQPAAYQQSPFNVQPTTCTQNVFGFPNQQSSGTSGQGCPALFVPPAPQIAYASNSSFSNCGMPGQVSATSNPSGSSTFVGGGQAFVQNQQVGSRKWPYYPTTETDGKFTSISAMHIYSDKSHEELRLEDYQLEKSQGTSFPAAENSTNMSNRSFLFPAPLSSTTASQPSVSASTSSPASGSSTVAPLSSVSASASSSVFGTNTGPPLFSVSASTSTLESGHSTIMPNQSCLFPAKSCSSAVQAAFKACNRSQKLPHPNVINIREPDDSCVPKGLEVIVENLGFNPWSQGKDNASKLHFPALGGILSCVEADKDEDIITLAEFAVEQHKALHKDDCTATFSKVVVACLEPFEGGRYHIVLDTIYSGPGFMPPKRHYAVVLRKCSPRANYLTVLEKWLSS